MNFLLYMVIENGNRMRYLVYPDTIIEVDSEKKLMKILLRDFAPSIYDDFWQHLVLQNGILVEFTQAIQESYRNDPDPPRRHEPLYTIEQNIWEHLMDKDANLMERIGNLFNEMIDSGRITLDKFPNDHRIERDRDTYEYVRWFRKISDMKVIKS